MGPSSATSVPRAIFLYLRTQDVGLPTLNVYYVSLGIKLSAAVDVGGRLPERPGKLQSQVEQKRVYQKRHFDKREVKRPDSRWDIGNRIVIHPTHTRAGPVSHK